MTSMCHGEFADRVASVPVHGLGLSVDVYSPDVFAVIDELHRAQLVVRYLELFKAHDRALKAVRSRFSRLPLEYHGDGLWMTQPDWLTAYPARAAVDEAARHVQTLKASWLNHECASKQMAGYAFGTYVPPLLTKDSALVTARHARWIQTRLDAWAERVWRASASPRPPLLLLETPPLTYVGFGDVGYADFFRFIADQAACGFVLDVGHVWTAYRYRERMSGKTLSEFLDELLDRFPLERVVQIHVAGLAEHPAVPSRENGGASLDPMWLDCHAAPVPAILFDLLDRILVHPRLTNLRGVALEVDTKSIEVIVQEFARFRERYDWWEHRVSGQAIDRVQEDRIQKSNDEEALVLRSSGFGEAPVAKAGELDTAGILHDLARRYREYAGAMTGRGASSRLAFDEPGVDAESLRRYVDHYRPFEILVWGGTVQDMFPRTVAALEACAIPLQDFVSFWFREPKPSHDPYDFFLLKIDRFLEFVASTMPDGLAVAMREAEELRRSYAMANEEGFSLLQ